MRARTWRCSATTPSSPRRALVTGAGGFVGANLVRRLLEQGDDVAALSRGSSPGWRLTDVASDIRLVEADLRDAERTADAVRDLRPERIFHLAAHGAYSWERDRHAILETNLLGTVNLLDACLERGFEAFVHAGSSSEYGFKSHAPAEDEPLEPNSDYAVAKAAATLYCSYVARTHGAPCVTLRLYSVYGPWEEPNRLVPTLLLRAREGQLPPLVDPRVARDFVFVDDVCDAFLRAAEAPASTVYNVASGTQTTIEEIVGLARELFAVEAEPAWGAMPNRDRDTSVWQGEIRRIRRELGWEPPTSLREGLVRTHAWLEAHPGVIEHYRRELAPAAQPR